MRLDVLIVGLGPAGASAAAAAAQAGARVLAIDKRQTPGQPVQCAEFVPLALAGETPAVRAAMVQEIAAMETFLGAAPPLRSDDFRGVMIDRAVFDAALVAQAGHAGATLGLGVALSSAAAGGMRLSDGRVVHPAVVIGADGPRSVVGRLAGRVNRALCEARQITVPLLAPHDATDIILRPEIRGGYGWLFPRGGEANLGLGLDVGQRHRLKPVLAALRAEMLAQGRIGPGQRRLTGGTIPVGGLVGPLAQIGPIPVLLAGDAAGLTHPITGAGIASAVLSGRSAGQAAAAIAQGRAGAVQDYAEEITDLFAPMLALAVQRREALLSRPAPGPADLRRAWIAYPDYRTPTDALAKEPA